MTWELKEDQDISLWHCGRPGYWDGDDVYCSKCQDKHQGEAEIESWQDGVWEIKFVYELFVISTVAYGQTKQQAIMDAESKLPNINEELLEIETKLEGII